MNEVNWYNILKEVGLVLLQLCLTIVYFVLNKNYTYDNSNLILMKNEFSLILGLYLLITFLNMTSVKLNLSFVTLLLTNIFFIKQGLFFEYLSAFNFVFIFIYFSYLAKKSRGNRRLKITTVMYFIVFCLGICLKNANFILEKEYVFLFLLIFGLFYFGFKDLFIISCYFLLLSFRFVDVYLFVLPLLFILVIPVKTIFSSYEAKLNKYFLPLISYAGFLYIYKVDHILATSVFILFLCTMYTISFSLEQKKAFKL